MTKKPQMDARLDLSLVGGIQSLEESGLAVTRLLRA